MKKPKTKNDPIFIRATVEEHNKIRELAALRRQSVTQYMLTRALGEK